MTSRPEQPAVYLASIALEPNRWKKEPQRVPSLRVSEWSGRAAGAGFDGWELWERHFLLADAAEREALRDGELPVTLFNTYQRPGLDSLDDWKRVVEAVAFLGPQVRGIKFNLGPEGVPFDEQVGAALEWAGHLPEGVRMLCECHPGTVLETPEAAREAFMQWPAGRFGAILHPLNKDPCHCGAWFSALGGRIEHLHWQARDADNKVCPLSAGKERLDVVVKSLHRHGYAGTHSVEFVKGTGQPGESVAGLFEAAIADLKTLRSVQFGL
jgi:sugar phosphate isomerase/epimerase